ncbi:hypothetical protein ABW21_db0200006 [Orbilia brochopaga]|nr:hypothetical protein ABW21_db0200006 [Drechslerella brochopaga]
MAAVAGKRGGGLPGAGGPGYGHHQRSNSTPFHHSANSGVTATRNNSNRPFSTSSSAQPTTSTAAATTTPSATTSTTTATTSSSFLTTPQHRLLSKTSANSATSTSSATTSATNQSQSAQAQPQSQSARRRLTSSKRHSSTTSQSGPVSPLSPGNSASSSTTIVSAFTPSAVPSKRHSAGSADLITRARSSAQHPLPDSSSSSSHGAARHSRRSSDEPKVTTRRGTDSHSRTSALGQSRASRTATAVATPVVSPLTKSSATSVSKSTRRPTAAADSAASTPSRTLTTSPISPPLPPTVLPTTAAAAVPVPSSLPSSSSSVLPPSAPAPPEASSAGIPPHIQAELDRHASIQSSQPPRRPRAPARFSSNGIATVDAPPPSLAFRHLPPTAVIAPPPSIPPPPPAPQPPPPRPSVEDEVEDFKYPPPLEESSTASVSIEIDDQYLAPPARTDIMTTYESDQFVRTNGGVLNNGLSSQYHATVEDDEPTIKDLQRVVQDDRGSFSSSPEPSSVRTPGSQTGEDPFLNLARSSTPRSQALLDAQARQERRRSRMLQYSVNSGRTSGLAHEYTSSSSRPQRSAASTTVSDDSFGGVELAQPSYQTPGEPSIPDTDYSLNHRTSFLRRQREAAAAQNGHARSASEIPRPRTNAPPSEMSLLPRAQTTSVLRSPISTLIESDRAQNAAQARLGINDDLQSTVSSGTVWDELDELKMRIKRLELTGTLPPASSSLSGIGSGISNSSGERPRTGTTAATTVSNSPRHQNQQISEVPAAAAAANAANAAAAPMVVASANGPPPTIHPVLHAALAKTKTVLPEHIIKALDALANDTLNLAEAVGSTGQSTMSINSALNSPEKQLITDRQIRRKVDNVCRSLTELCVSLADGRMPFEAPADQQTAVAVPQQPLIQTPQIQQQQLPPPSFPTRAEDPIERAVTAFDYRSPSAIGHKIDREATVTPNSAARAHARFEARRASLLGAPSPQYISRQEASPSPQPGANRLSHRNSMSLRTQRNSMQEPEEELEIPVGLSIRSPSRASNINGMQPQLSPMRATYPSQSYESTPLQRTLTLREQRAQQMQANYQDINAGLLSTSALQHRRNFSTATMVTPQSNAGLSVAPQRRSYLDRERGVVDPNIGTAITTGTGIGSASQPIDISRRRTEYLRAAGVANPIEPDMAYSPPMSVSGASVAGSVVQGRGRTSSMSSRVGSIRARPNLLGSGYTGRVDTGLGLGRDRILNTTRR